MSVPLATTEVATKNVFKRKNALWFLFSIQSFDYGATTVVKISMYST